MWQKKLLNEGNQICNFLSSSGSGTVINYGSDSDFLTSYGSGSGSTRQKDTVPTVPVPVPQHCPGVKKAPDSGSGSATLAVAAVLMRGVRAAQPQPTG